MKQRMVDVMRHLMSLAANNPKLLLPQPDTTFVTALELLTKTNFNLVVCGKVKYGKSSFINALVGRNILPVCTNVATSQIFKITNADKDSCEVVYTNGDKKDIGISELENYGSQNAIDRNGLIDARKAISYIEVNTSATFIPSGVSILDTPGIGATYPQHTAITKQCIRMADAVLFVMNPTPLEKIETDFLREIVEITPNIMFVMTKIDNNGEDSINESIARNKALIEESIGSKLWQPVKIYQMSSTMLSDASLDIVTADYTIANSGYHDVKEGIAQLISLTQDFFRVGNAYNEALHYYNTVLQSIDNRISAAEVQGEKASQLRQQFAEARQSLNNLGGQRQAEILEEIGKIIRAFDSEFYQNTSTTGTIAQKFYAEIDGLEKDTIEEYNEHIAENVLNDLQEEWDRLTDILSNQISATLRKYDDACGNLFNNTIALPNITLQNDKATLSSVTLHKRFVHMRNDAMLGVGAFTIINFTLLGAIPVVGPILALGAIAGASWGLYSGNVKAKAEVVEKNKAALKNFVKDVITDFRKQYTEVSLENGQYESIIEGYKTSTRQYVNEQLIDIYTYYSNEVKALEETLQANQGESVTLLKALRDKWDQNKKDLSAIRDYLETIGKQAKK